MSMKWIASAFLCTGLAIACGGGGGGGGDGSGVDRDEVVADLSQDELGDLCEYFIGLQEQPERTVDCGDGVTLTVGINPEDVDEEIADCASEGPPAGCPVTVGEVEDCFEQLEAFSDAQLCSDTTELPAACDFINDPLCQ
ncbi:MAG: hypothetical protein H0V17_29255 [Deltaproteobacteria bacterium]|nr:hypothetical protein [Deltaproteobacteria bacterium]